MNLLGRIRIVFVVLFGLGLFVLAVRNATDPDLWWHMRTGQLTLEQHLVFHNDPYSFTATGKPWVNHEWFSDVLIYALYRSTGFDGLILAFAAIVAIAFFLVFLRSSGGVYLAGIMTLWGALASAPSWGVRPQTFTLLLASIFLWILERSPKKKRLLWWTIPLMLLWVNLHAGFVLGLGFIALFLLGGLIDVAVGAESWATTAPRLRTLTIAFAGCALVVPLNPYGVKMYVYPWQTVSSRAMAEYIQEWFSPDFHKLMYLPFLLMILGLMVLLAIASKRLRPTDLLLLGVTLFAGLHSVRHIPIFALVAAPIMSRLAASFLEKRAWRFPLESPPNMKKAVLNLAFIFVWMMFVGVRIHWVLNRQELAISKNFPVAAVAFLKTHPLPGPVLNSYNWGGYMIWKLPEYHVFVDGRADVYGDRFLENLAEIYYVRDNWQQKFDFWHIHTVFLPPDAPLVSALRLRGWNAVFADKQAIILTQPGR